MRISPLLIKKQEFTRTLRGFDVEEVQAFLDKLANDVELLIRENEMLTNDVEILNERVEEFQKIEKNLQDTLLKAQDSSSKAMDSTKKQTGLMIKEAEIKATQIVEKARKDANELRDAVSKLKEEKDLIVAKLKAIVSTQAQLLEGKVKEAGEESPPAKEKEPKENIDIDVDDIVNKLL
jgi:cell division initiation protein